MNWPKRMSGGRDMHFLAKTTNKSPTYALTTSSTYGCGKRHATSISWNQTLKLVTWLWRTQSQVPHTLNWPKRMSGTRYIVIWGKNLKMTPIKRRAGNINIWRRQTPYQPQFKQSDSETCNMALKNTVTGATHFELAKTDVSGPTYSHLGHKFINDAFKKP